MLEWMFPDMKSSVLGGSREASHHSLQSCNRLAELLALVDLMDFIFEQNEVHAEILM